jgi:hypothetical protein
MMLAILIALFFALALIGACAVIAYAVRNNVDAITSLLRNYAETGGTWSESPYIRAHMVTPTQPLIAPFKGAFTGLSASPRKSAIARRTSQTAKLSAGMIMPGALRAVA